MINQILKINTMQGFPPVETPMLVYTLHNPLEVFVNCKDTTYSDYNYFYWRAYSKDTDYTSTNFNRLVSLALNFKSAIPGIVKLRSIFVGESPVMENSKLTILPATIQAGANRNLVCSVEYGNILNNVLLGLRKLLNKILGTDATTYASITPEQYNRILKLTVLGPQNPVCSPKDIKLLHQELNNLYNTACLFENDSATATNYLITMPAITLTKELYLNLRLGNLFNTNNMNQARFSPGSSLLWPPKLISSIDAKVLLSTWTIDQDKQRWLNYTP